MKNAGFIIINKEVGPTSHDIIYKLRKITGIKKIGHAGTLDPLASGILVVAIGREATKNISKFVKQDKKYIATLYLGATTDTYDAEGAVRQETNNKKQITKKDIQDILLKFVGKQEQLPPMYSAKKVGGKKLYDLARKGVEIKRKPSLVEINDIDLLEYDWPILKINVHCSSGTYIRSLTHDIGERLGCGAYLAGLERVESGVFNIKQARKIKELTSDNWQDFLIEE